MENIYFSPPDITEAEINEVCEALRSGWITTAVVAAIGALMFSKSEKTFMDTV